MISPAGWYHGVQKWRRIDWEKEDLSLVESSDELSAIVTHPSEFLRRWREWQLWISILLRLRLSLLKRIFYHRVRRTVSQISGGNVKGRVNCQFGRDSQINGQLEDQISNCDRSKRLLLTNVNSFAFAFAFAFATRCQWHSSDPREAINESKKDFGAIEKDEISSWRMRDCVLNDRQQ
jgi:hypothetical protein